MIHFACQHCQASVKAPDGKQGKWAECPACGIYTQVPQVVDYPTVIPVIRVVPRKDSLPVDPEVVMQQKMNCWQSRLLIVACGCLLLYWILSWLIPIVFYPERRAIRTYLAEHLHDPEGMEIVSWDESKLVWVKDNEGKKQFLFVRASVRARNGLGNRRIRECLFLLGGNYEVVRSVEVNDFYRSRGATRNWDYDWALQKLGLDPESLD